MGENILKHRKMINFLNIQVVSKNQFLKVPVPNRKVSKASFN